MSWNEPSCLPRLTDSSARALLYCNKALTTAWDVSTCPDCHGHSDISDMRTNTRTARDEIQKVVRWVALFVDEIDAKKLAPYRRSTAPDDVLRRRPPCCE